MNFRIIRVIIGREYMTRVKKKSFLVTTFVVPVLFALLCSIPALILTLSKGKDKTIAYVDESGYVSGKLEDTKQVAFEDFTGHLSAEELKAQMDNLDFDGILLITPKAEGKEADVNVTTYSTKPVSVEIKEMLTQQIEEAVEDYRLQQYEIDGLKEIMQDVKADVQIVTYTIDEDGEEKETSSEVFMIISMLLSMIIYMFVSMFAGTVMQSVIEEKSSRIVEVLVSSVKAIELMIGKIVGVALVALTQFFLWIVLTVVLVGAFSSIVGFDKLVEGSSSTTQMMEMAGMDSSMMDPSTMTMTMDEHSELGAVLETLQNINYVQLIVAFVLFFVLGYLLYASLFAAVGSAVDNEADTNQLVLPLTIPLMIGFFVGLYAFNSPDSQLVWWCSMIPFTSPIVMLSRIPFGVATWELILSLGLLFLTFLGGAWVSAKIYKVGILMYGKKSSFKDLWKWIRMK
ncbi:MAG: ABC transporter permease [Bacteroidales bacterium]|nr:ABC transporter permease [Candidatus Cryptobacteroides caccocaballi]